MEMSSFVFRLCISLAQCSARYPFSLCSRIGPCTGSYRGWMSAGVLLRFCNTEPTRLPKWLLTDSLLDGSKLRALLPDTLCLRHTLRIRPHYSDLTDFVPASIVTSQLYTTFLVSEIHSYFSKASTDMSIGSWYRGHEISRRGGIWYTGLPLGTLTAGLVQAGATRRLEGVHGLSGWRYVPLSN